MYGSPLVAKGKKRKFGLFIMREPTGRPSRQLTDADLESCSASQIKRLRDASLAEMSDPEWGTELGRLYLQGKITIGQYGAGKWFSMLSTSCRAALDAPAHPRKSAFVRGVGGHDPDPDSDEGRKQAQRDREAVQSFMEVHAALIGAGMLAERMVRNVCEDDKMIEGHAQLLYLRTGLEWLAEYRRRLTGQEKNGRSSK